MPKSSLHFHIYERTTLPYFRKLLVSWICLVGIFFSSCSFSQTIFDQQQKKEAIYQARFESALEKFSQGFINEAIQELQDLYIDTKSPRVQLELARLLFLNGQNSASQALFQNVLDSNPPFMVRERIGNYLDEITTSNGRIDYSFGITSDSNPRSITSDRSIVIGGLSYNYNPGFELNNNYGLSYIVALSKALDDRNQWIVGMNAVGAKFENTLFDRFDLLPYLSYRLTDQPKVFVIGRYENYWFGGQKLFEYPHLELKTTHEFADASYFSSSIKSGQMTYPDYDYLSGQFSQAVVTYGKPMNENVLAGVDIGLDRNHAMVRSYSFQTEMVSVFGTVLIPDWFIKGQLKLTLQNRVFDEEDPYFGEVRVDKKKGAYLTLLKTNLKIAGLSPMLELGYEVNDSNLALYSYTRYIANISLKKMY